MQKNNSKNFKLKNIGIINRLYSSFILFFIYGLYLGFAVLNNEMWVQYNNKVLSFVFGGFFMLSTIALLTLMFLELTKNYKISNKFVMSFLVVFGILFYFVPIGSYTSIQNGLFIYNYSLSLISLLSNVWMQIILVFCFFGLFLLFAKIGKLSTVDALVFGLMLMIIVFGLKGVTNIALSVDYQNPTANYDSIQFGYLTAIWIWLGIILTDSFAYLFGVKFGKHKMSPKISPNKSWEGAIGGFCTSVVILILAALIIYFLKSPFNVLNLISSTMDEPIVIILYILFAIIISIITQFGDLLFSWVKRSKNIKDYSNLIPGHGGLLDRLDSFVVVFALMYIITRFF